MIRHTKMSTLSRCALLSFLVSTTMAVLGSIQAQANDRDLRATPVPAAACVEFPHQFAHGQSLARGGLLLCPPAVLAA